MVTLNEIEVLEAVKSPESWLESFYFFEIHQESWREAR
jgi:hypothetical protein